jgi:rubrerythrin
MERSSGNLNRLILHASRLAHKSGSIEEEDNAVVIGRSFAREAQKNGRNDVAQMFITQAQEKELIIKYAKFAANARNN